LVRRIRTCLDSGKRLEKIGLRGGGEFSAEKIDMEKGVYCLTDPIKNSVKGEGLYVCGEGIQNTDVIG
jgi:hypothetical protein